MIEKISNKPILLISQRILFLVFRMNGAQTETEAMRVLKKSTLLNMHWGNSSISLKVKVLIWYLIKPQDLLFIRKFVHRMNGSNRKIVDNQILIEQKILGLI